MLVKQTSFGYFDPAIDVDAMGAWEISSAPITRSRGTAVERVVAHLREGILNRRYAPGQRLIEADLTGELEVSRGPVREAFRRLAAEGLIETVPNRGALVRRLSLRETVELFEVRTWLEALAARRAAENMADPAIRARFERAIEPIWDDSPRLYATAYIEENQRFHQAILEASGNEQLAGLSRRLQLSLIMFQLSGALSMQILAESVSEHREIARAILNGEAEGAEAAIRKHLSRAERIVRDMPPTAFRP